MPAGITVVDVVAGIDFATICISGVAVLPRVGAVCDAATTIEASWSTVCHAASDGTRAAGSHVRV